MIQPALYYIVLLLELILITSVFLYLLSLIYSSLKGAPYVPTKQKLIQNILDEANLKRGQRFLELGCGDGRVVRFAVKKYGAKGVGIDVNPLVLLLAQIKTRMENILNISFLRQNVSDADVAEFDVVYLFLLPELLDKLTDKLEKETRDRVLIISHGFQIPSFKKYHIKTVMTDPFPTYYYKKGLA